MHPLVMVCPIITNQNLEQLGCTAAKYKWYTYQKWQKKGTTNWKSGMKKNKFEKKDFHGRELNPGLPGERQTS